MKNEAWIRTPIDRFILSGLEADDFEPAPPLDRARLIRRAYFDLIGLPPTPEAVRAFVADQAPDAYERLIDQLLADPRYGERWARYWLDVVRYADTNGYERDAEKNGAWRYRDWVIRSFNEDMPYDRFVLEQLAGDELPDANEQTLAATGMLRVGTFDDEPNEPLQYKFEQLDDLVHATATAFLGLTIKCARCHDHKFDPISQKDYYAYLNFFVAGKAGRRARAGLHRRRARAPRKSSCSKGEIPSAKGTSSRSISSRWFRNSSARSRLPRPRPRRRSAARSSPVGLPIRPIRWRRAWRSTESGCTTLAKDSVARPDNFGVMGTPPTHPGIARLVDGRVYRRRLADQAAPQADHAVERVPDGFAPSARRRNTPCATSANEHWYRANRHRIDAEALRDAMLVGQRPVESQGRRAWVLPSRESGRAGRAFDEREGLEGFSARGAAPSQHLYVHQAIFAAAADDDF